MPDKGAVYCQGVPLTKKDTLNKFTFLGNNDRSFFWRLSVKDNLEYFRGVYEKEDNAITRLLFDNLSIEKFMNRSFGSLSSGEKKKVTLYRGLLKNPDVLLFDEFTQSLDLPSKKEIESIVHALKNDFKKTIIWVSHDLDEIFRLCNKAILIEDGKINFEKDIESTNTEDIETLHKLISS